jgi:hypothetical protein
MRYSAMFLAAAFLSGCGGEGTGPSTAMERAGRSPEGAARDTSAQRSLVLLKVVESSGACIVGASVRVVSGQAAGQTREQQTICDAWSYGDEIEFKDLTPGVAMTIRASAPGYAPKDATVTPSSYGVYAATLIVLTRE